MSGVTVDARPTGVRFQVRLQPRASANEISGVANDALRIRLHAPPVDGAANEALVKFLADLLDVPRAAVRIATGATSRTKTIEVDGVTPRDIAALVPHRAEDEHR